MLFSLPKEELRICGEKDLTKDCTPLLSILPALEAMADNDDEIGLLSLSYFSIYLEVKLVKTRIGEKNILTLYYKMTLTL
jgi:hypothetical protein